MANTGFKGINVRQTGSKLLFRASIKDSSLANVVSGTANLRLYEYQDDGTLKSYDWADNTFKTTALSTEDQALTHRAGNNATRNLGVWTYALSTLDGFTVGGMYLAKVIHASGSPTEQEREFQYGSAEGDLATTALATGIAALQSDLQKWIGSVPNAINAGRVDAIGPITRSNTIQSATGLSVVLDASASASDNKYRYMWIYFTSGNAAGECDQIISYVGSSKTATVTKGWVNAPTTGDSFVILPQAPNAINWQAVFGQGTTVNLTGTSTAIVNYANYTGFQYTVSAATANTVTTSTAGIGATNRHRGSKIVFLSGVAINECHVIKSHTNLTITIEGSWGVTPNAGDVYAILRDDLPVSNADRTVHSDLRAILGTTLTETVGGYLAAGFKKLLDVVTPIFTLASNNQTGDAYAIVNSGAHGNAALKTAIDAVPTAVDAALAADFDAIPTAAENASAVVAALASGTGALACVIRIVDADDDPVQNFRVAIYSGSELIKNALTDADGEITVGLDAGTYQVVGNRGGWDTISESMVVTVAATFEFDTAPIVITPSTPPGVTGYVVIRENGAPVEDAIVRLNLISVPGTGRGDLADYEDVTTGADGIAEFTDMIAGAQYQYRIMPDGPWTPLTADDTDFAFPNTQN